MSDVKAMKLGLGKKNEKCLASIVKRGEDVAFAGNLIRHYLIPR